MNCLSLLVICILFSIAFSLPDPVYTIHYLKTFRRDLIEGSFGCGNAIVYGTYLYPKGLVDALYMLASPHVYGFNSRCQRKETYVKVLGADQDYSKLSAFGNIENQMHDEISRVSATNIIIDWKYLPEESKRQEARSLLQKIVIKLKTSHTVFVKAPASYFCLKVNGKRYLLDLPVDNFIVELYGQEDGKYLTIQSIFGNVQQPQIQGYDANCPKFPTKPQLYSASSDKKFYFEKTLDPSLSGYIGPRWEEYLLRTENQPLNGVYFYDGFPGQSVDL